MPLLRFRAPALPGLPCLLALLCWSAGPSLAAPAPALKAESGLDATRLGRVDEAERRALREEWRIGQFRADELTALDEIHVRLGRMEVTMRELFRLIEKLPAPSAAAAAPKAAASAPNEAALPAEAAGIPLALLVQGGVAALALAAAFGILRRRQAAISHPAESIPATPPDTAADTVAAAPAVAPAPTVVPPPTTDEWPHPATTGLFRLDLEDAAAAAEELPDADVARTDRDTLDLAEIMLSMGMAKNAADALTDFIGAHPRQALHHWLKLLDVYRRSGNRPQFEKSVRELRERFNVQAESWARLSAGETTQLEAFPRVAEQVVRTWGQPPQALAYLTHLLEDNRGGTRAGFPQPVAEDILLLIALLKARIAEAG